MRAAVPVIFVAFDLLYANGELTLHLPLRQRRNRLETIAERLAGRAVSPLASVSEQLKMPNFAGG